MDLHCAADESDLGDILSPAILDIGDEEELSLDEELAADLDAGFERPESDEQP